MASVRRTETSHAAGTRLLSETIILTALLLASLLMFLLILSPTLQNKLYLNNDLHAFMIPLKYLYASGLRAGRLDLWTPTIFSGFYMHGEGQIGMLHPFHLLLYRFVPFTQAFGLELLAIYLVLFAGSYLFFYDWTQERVSALFGAFMFTFGGTNLLSIIHVNKVAVIAHLPWMLLAVDRCFRYRGHKANVTFICLALLNASAVLFGYPYWLLMCLALQAWYAVYLLFVMPSTAGMIRVIGGASTLR